MCIRDRFFDSAFSNKGCCCKVRHARILWFLQWILTIFKFYVFLQRVKKTKIRARISMQKRSKFWLEIPRKSDAKNHGISSKIHGNLLLGRFFWPFRCLWPLSLATKRVAEARCHVATATKRPVARGKRPVARGKWPVVRGKWLVVSSHSKCPHGSGFWI